jgi:integrase
MPRKRRTKRAFEFGKRCHCQDRAMCSHDWWLRVYSAGKRQRINLTEMFPADVVEVAAAKAKDLARKGLIISGELVHASKDTRLTFGDVADRYAAAHTLHKPHYLEGLRAIEVPAARGTVVKLADKPIDEVTTADIKHAKSVWEKRPRSGPSAIRHLLQTARHLFSWANREELVTRTPFSRDKISLISVPKSGSRTRRLEEGEEERILAVADPFITDFFRAMIETGCRPGELRTLQWSEVQSNRFVILKSKAKTRKERKVPIEPKLRAILDQRRTGPDGNDLPSDAYVFGSETGEMFTRTRLCQLWAATCKLAKVTNLHLHDLRGEFASQLAESGVSIHETRDALGHSSTTMTSTYLRTRTDSLDAAYKQRTAHRARQAMKRVS